MGQVKFLDGLLVPINVTTDTFQLPTPLEVKEQQETKNYVACLKQANEAIYEKQNQGIEADDNPLSEQFFSRWRSEAVHIANEDMQQLWGRLLTEEIITEGSVSLRTLDIMRNMTRRDAEIFEHACKYVVQGDLVAFDITITARHDLPMRGPVRPLDWSHFNPLQNLGLVEQVQKTSELDILPVPGPEIGIIHPHALIRIETIFDPLIKGYSLTASGKELFRIATQATAENVEFFCGFLQSTRPLRRAKISYDLNAQPASGEPYDFKVYKETTD